VDKFVGYCAAAARKARLNAVVAPLPQSAAAAKCLYKSTIYTNLRGLQRRQALTCHKSGTFVHK
jgi:hypothetical protein